LLYYYQFNVYVAINNILNFYFKENDNINYYLEQYFKFLNLLIFIENNYYFTNIENIWKILKNIKNIKIIIIIKNNSKFVLICISKFVDD
jgi:hypothetical protein